MFKTGKIINKILISFIIIIIAFIIKGNSVEASVGISWSNLTSKSNHYYCCQHGWEFHNKTYYFNKGSSKTITTGNSNKQTRILAWILSTNSYYGSSASSKTSTQKALWYWINHDKSKSSIKNWFPNSTGGSQGKTTAYTTAANKANTVTPYSTNESVIKASLKLTADYNGKVTVSSLNGTVSKVVIYLAKNDGSSTGKTVTISGSSSKYTNWIELYTSSDCKTAVKVEDISTSGFYIKNLKNSEYYIKKIEIKAKSKASGYQITMTKYTHGTAQNLIKVSVKKGVSKTKTVTLTSNYSDGSLKLVKTGVYYQDGKKVTSDNVSATFKIYCSSLGKWVSGDADEIKTYVDKDDFDSASEYTSGTTVSNLYAGYKYRIVEISAQSEDGDNYYDEVKMTSATANGTELAISTYTVDGEKYPITDKITIEKDKTITVKATDARTSGDITLYKVDAADEKSYISDVQIRIYYSETAGGEGGWLTKNEDGTYSYDGVLSEEDSYTEETSTGDNNSTNSTVLDDETEEDNTQYESYEGDSESETEDEDENVADADDEEQDNETDANSTDEEGALNSTVTLESIFTTDEEGKIELNCVKAGYYYFYEVGTPDGINLEDQPGYQSDYGSYTFGKDNNWSYLGTTTLNYGNSKSNNSITVKYNQYREVKLEILKTDEITGEELEGAEFKIYAVLNNGEEGWVKGNATSTKTYVTSASKATAYSAGTEITNLRYGTYYIYETKAPTTDENYVLADQDGYHDTSNGEAKGYESFDENEDWVYKGMITLDLKSSSSTTAVTITNNPEAELQIEKVDEEYNELKLEGAEFVIYADLTSEGITDGWVSGEKDGVKTYVTNATNATTYKTDSDGLINLTKLSYGTYYIYETKAPDGYDITKQDGYLDTSAGNWTSSLSGDWSYLGKIDIPAGSTEEGIAEGKIVAFEFTGTNVKKVNELEGLVWVDEPDTKGNTGNNLYKENGEDQQDYELENIEVRLYLEDENGNYHKAATTYTEKDGTYTFNFDPESSNYCGVEVTYWQLVTAYVEFVYDNTEYVVVDPFVTATNGMDITINSKAQEVEMEAEELEDENLTGTTGDYPGLAVTYQGGTAPTSLDEINAILSNNETVVSGQSTTEILKTTSLAGYYEQDGDTNHYKISNINLGLLDTLDPAYTITETLSYAYLTINGYTYTYYYDTPVDETIEYARTDDLPADVLKQMNSADYSKTDKVSVYASDVESTYVAGTSNMKLYLVYGIYVYNSQTYRTDDVYYEEKLYLTSLTDEYDTNRMELSTDNSDNSNCIGYDQFSLWSRYDDGKVTYDLDNEKSNYSSGIGAGETIKTYVQFQVTDNALYNLIYEKDTIVKWNKENVSTAYASGFHEYRRTDNLWNQTETASSRWYNDHKGETYTETNEDGDPYYIHKSEIVDEDSGSYYVTLILYEEDVYERTISSVVYVDESGTDDEGNETGVGNGIIDEDEENRVSGVEVTLLQASITKNDDETVTINTEVADLYQVNDSGGIVKEDDGSYPKAVTTTNEAGEFTFEGVIPGYYYVQFTYGDGTQTIGYIDDDGTYVEVDDLTSNDYRSTIINTNEAGKYIKDPLELDDSSIISYAEALENYYNGELNDNKAAEILEWYKSLSEDTEFNTGVDDISDSSNRNIMNSYEYTSQGVYKVTTDENEEEVRTQIAKYDTDEYGNITLTGTDFPLNVTARTPITSVSIENDNETSTEVVYDEETGLQTNIHKSTFSGFNFGVIKQETEVEIEKAITKASITLQQGSTVYSGNPATESSTYATSLETVALKNNLKGSKYIRVELEDDMIYGSAVEVEYTVTITNNSAVSYDTDNWFKYGIVGTDDDKKESTVTINEIVDLLDSKFSVKSLLNNDNGITGTITATYIGSNGEATGETSEITVSTNSLYEEVGNYYQENAADMTDLYFSGFNEMKTGESVQITYSVDGYLNSDEDTEFNSKVELTSLSLSGLKTLNSDFVWPWAGTGTTSDTTKVAITPETGGNKANTYWVVGAIALLVVAGGVVILKKSVLK